MSFDKNNYISDNDEDDEPPSKKKKLRDLRDKAKKENNGQKMERAIKESKSNLEKKIFHRSAEIHSKNQARRSSDEENVSPVQIRSKYNQVPCEAKKMDRPYEPWEKPLDKTIRIPKKDSSARNVNNTSSAVESGNKAVASTPPRDDLEEKLAKLHGLQKSEDKSRYTPVKNIVTEQASIIIGREQNILCSPSHEANYKVYNSRAPTKDIKATEQNLVIMEKEKHILCSPLKESRRISSDNPSQTSLPENPPKRKDRSSKNKINNAKGKKEKFTWSISPVREENSSAGKQKHRSRRESFERKRDEREEYTGPETRSRSRSRSMTRSPSLPPRSRNENRQSPPVTRSSSRSRSLPPEENRSKSEKDNEKSSKHRSSRGRSQSKSKDVSTSEKARNRRRSRSRSRYLSESSRETSVESDYENRRITRSRSRSLSVEVRDIMKNDNKSSNDGMAGRLRDRSKSREPDRYSPSLYSSPRSTSKSRKDAEKSKHHEKNNKNSSTTEKSHHKRSSSSQRKGSTGEIDKHKSKNLPSTSKNGKDERSKGSRATTDEIDRKRKRESQESEQREKERKREEQKSKHGKDEKKKQEIEKKRMEEAEKKKMEKPKPVKEKSEREKESLKKKEERELQLEREKQKKKEERELQLEREKQKKKERELQLEREKQKKKEDHEKKKKDPERERRKKEEPREKEKEREKKEEERRNQEELERERREKEPKKVEEQRKEKREKEPKRIEERERKKKEEERKKKDQDWRKKDHEPEKKDQECKNQEEEERKIIEEQKQKKKEEEESKLRKERHISKEKPKLIKEKASSKMESRPKNEHKRRKDEARNERTDIQERKETSEVLSKKNEHEEKRKNEEDRQKEKIVSDLSEEDNIQFGTTNNVIKTNNVAEARSKADMKFKNKLYRRYSEHENKADDKPDENSNLFNYHEKLINYSPKKIYRSSSDDCKTGEPFAHIELNSKRRFSDDHKLAEGKTLEGWTNDFSYLSLRKADEPIDLRVAKGFQTSNSVKESPAKKIIDTTNSSCLYEDISDAELSDDKSTVIFSDGEEAELRRRIIKELESSEPLVDADVGETKTVCSKEKNKQSKEEIEKERLIRSLKKAKKKELKLYKKKLNRKRRKERREEKRKRKDQLSASFTEATLSDEATTSIEANSSTRAAPATEAAPSVKATSSNEAKSSTQTTSATEAATPVKATSATEAKSSTQTAPATEALPSVETTASTEAKTSTETAPSETASSNLNSECQATSSTTIETAEITSFDDFLENLVVISDLIKALHDQYQDIKSNEKRLKEAATETTKKLYDQKVKDATKCYQNLVLEHCNTIIDNYETLRQIKGSGAVYAEISKINGIEAEEVSKLINHCLQTESHKPVENNEKIDQNKESSKPEQSQNIPVEATTGKQSSAVPAAMGNAILYPTVLHIPMPIVQIPMYQIQMPPQPSSPSASVNLQYPPQNQSYYPYSSSSSFTANPSNPVYTNSGYNGYNGYNQQSGYVATSAPVNNPVSNVQTNSNLNLNLNSTSASVAQSQIISPLTTTASSAFTPRAASEPSNPALSSSTSRQAVNLSDPIPTFTSFTSRQSVEPSVHAPPASSISFIAPSAPIANPVTNVQTNWSSPSVSAAQSQIFSPLKTSGSSVSPPREVSEPTNPARSSSILKQSVEPPVPAPSASSTSFVAPSAPIANPVSNVQTNSSSSPFVSVPQIPNFPPSKTAASSTSTSCTREASNPPDSTPSTSAPGKAVNPSDPATSTSASRVAVNPPDSAPSTSKCDQRTSAKEIHEPQNPSSSISSQNNEQIQAEQTKAPSKVNASKEAGKRKEQKRPKQEIAVQTESSARNSGINIKKEKESENRTVEKGEVLYKTANIKKEIPNIRSPSMPPLIRTNINVKKEKTQRRNMKSVDCVDLVDDSDDDDDDAVEVLKNPVRKVEVADLEQEEETVDDRNEPEINNNANSNVNVNGKEKEATQEGRKEDKDQNEEEEDHDQENRANGVDAEEGEEESDKEGEEDAMEEDEDRQEESLNDQPDESDADDEENEEEKRQKLMQLPRLIGMEKSCSEKINCATDCGSVAKFTCSSCKASNYCSVGCQKSHWIGLHFHRCAALKKMAEFCIKRR